MGYRRGSCGAERRRRPGRGARRAAAALRQAAVSQFLVRGQQRLRRARFCAMKDQAMSAHLKRLEAESIGIMREVVAEFTNPVMLYSIGKDSGVMLHLALKAFFPSKPPFPLLHVDTGWKFRDMIRHRDMIVARYGFKLLAYTNQDGVARGINPIRSGSQVHTQVMKTEALKQALDQYGFDAAFGGAQLGAAQPAPRAVAAV